LHKDGPHCLEQLLSEQFFLCISYSRWPSLLTGTIVSQGVTNFLFRSPILRTAPCDGVAEWSVGVREHSTRRPRACNFLLVCLSGWNKSLVLVIDLLSYGSSLQSRHIQQYLIMNSNNMYIIYIYKRFDTLF